MPDLLPDLITDILIRLPVKSLLQFRCMSKPFCSQIDGPDFSKLHLHHSSSRRSLILSNVPGCKLYSMDIHSLDQAREIDHPLSASLDWSRGVTIIGACNGLLCLFKYSKQILLWNPSTGKHLKLPSPPFNLQRSSFLSHHTNCKLTNGFGHHSLSDDYKVLIIVQSEGVCDSVSFVYSTKLNLWSMSSGFPYIFPSSQLAGVFVCGALHFMAYPQDHGGDNSWIVAIDIADYSYRGVPPPPFLSQSTFYNLGVLNDCLSVTCSLHSGSGVGVSTVWVMNDYAVSESWTMLLSMPWMPNINMSPLNSYVKPLATCSGGNGVILQRGDNRLLACDIKRKRVHRLRVLGRPKSFEADVFVESLVNPLHLALPRESIE